MERYSGSVAVADKLARIIAINNGSSLVDYCKQLMQDG